MDFTPEELENCLRVLQRVSEDPAMMATQERFKSLVAKIHREGKRAERNAARNHVREEDRAVRESAAIVQAQKDKKPVAALVAADTAALPEYHRSRPCYICKAPYTQPHFFYHLLCPECAALNYAKRSQRSDLTGRSALLTGGRIKIGFQVALRLLRDGASVLVTTRFPADAARRFEAEPDFGAWGGRLRICGLDLRNIPAVEAFAQLLLDDGTPLDILIHNAAQTIKRPASFYRALLEQEDTLPALAPLELAKESFLSAKAFMMTIAETFDESAYFPANAMDADGQPLDLRPMNSWRLRLGDVSTVEMLEVHLVNAVAPFVLNSRLKPLLLRSPFARRFIVNVSAMEGQFARENKTIYHPHTNMAKAALNMMTRTSAADYANDGIYMNSVDTGWITDENPYPTHERLRKEDGFYTPLDPIDAVARIYDPIARGVTNTETPLFGHFLKDYVSHAW